MKMITKEEFIQELKNEDYTDEELVEKYICFGIPVIFNDYDQKYYNLKKDISSQFPVQSKNNIIVVGSAKLGFSIAPQKRFREIQDESDIDVAIIDEELFDNYWERLFEFNVNLKSRTEEEDKLYRKFLQYFFQGWLRPDLFPFKFRGKNEWFDFFNKISYKEYDKRKVAAAIYKNEYFFKKYHEKNIRELREELKNGKI